MQDKTPKNSKGQRHGYWKRYWSDSQLWYKRYYINGIELGYDESYWSNGQLWFKKYYAR